MGHKTIKTISLLLSASQKQITDWFQGIDKAIAQKQALAEYDKKRTLLIPKLKEAHDQGVAYRELERITGIPYQTIARWLRKEKQEHDADTSKQ